ncbi:hypothetical protein AAC387_Pa04g2198 [Persea americana]
MLPFLPTPRSTLGAQDIPKSENESQSGMREMDRVQGQAKESEMEMVQENGESRNLSLSKSEEEEEDSRNQAENHVSNGKADLETKNVTETEEAKPDEKQSEDAFDSSDCYSDEKPSGILSVENGGKEGENTTEDSTAAEIDGKKLSETDAVETNGIVADYRVYSNGNPINGEDQLLYPHSHLPQPEAPPGLTKSASNGEDCNQIDRSVSATETSSFGKFLRDRSNSFSTSIIKRISSLKESNTTTTEDFIFKSKSPNLPSSVTEIHLPGLKVTVQLKDENNNQDLDLGLNLKGRISFFSRSSCRDCRAVRSFFREKGLRFVEINLDVYPEREKELIQRSRSSSVPQIFFNEKLVGGLVVLNSLRNSGELERRMREMMGRRCPESAPAEPVYGFDDDVEERTDEMVGIVGVLRQRLPIQDRIARMKIVRNCFAGAEMVEVLIQHLDCGRKKAVEIGKVLARKHFIHHVFQENDFEDGSHLYRFLEHEPTIPRCFNFRGSTNDSEPKPAAAVGQKLTKIMSAILEAYASEDRVHVDYTRISKSEEFRRYVNLVQDLQRVDILALSASEKLAFFLNLYNAMIIHAVIRIGWREGAMDRRTFYGDFNYIVGGYPYSLATIKNGILRSNQRQPYSLTKPFPAGDWRLEVALPKVNPLIHFGLCNGTRSSPTVRFFSAEGIDSELRAAAREFFVGSGIEVDLDKRTIYLTRIIKWYSADFGQEKDILKWILNYLDATKAGLLTHLLSDGGPINFVYQKYDWSLNY